MFHNPLVTVIIPCYNQGRFLAESLDSVLNQTYANWECIVINDGSTDNSEEIALGYQNKDKRIKYIKQENAGASAARNNGLTHAQGTFIQLLDGDDILESGKIGAQVEFLLAHDMVDIVYGGSRFFVDGEFEKKFILNELGDSPAIEVHYSDENQAAALTMRNFATICAPLYRKSVFDGGLTFRHVIFEDWLFHIECSLRGKKFHFERLPGSYCFIRITRSSQMYRHKAQHASSPDTFTTAINALLKQYNFIHPLPPLPVKKNYNGKEVAKLFIPPLFMEMYRFYKKRKNRATAP